MRRSAFLLALPLAAIAACTPLRRPGATPASATASRAEPGVTPVTSSAERPTALARGPARQQRGIDYTAWFAGQYLSGGSDETLRKLAGLGVQWIGLVVSGYQQQVSSTTIRWDAERTPTDDDLAHAIATIHDLGMQVMLKPHVDPLDGRWRGEIGTTFTSEAQWTAWFTSYRAAITHFADLAQAHRAAQLCIGTELAGLSGREADWRAIVQAVRERFRGKLVYASIYSEEQNVRWWDALDYIGIDAYYPLTDHAHPSVADLKRAWTDLGLVSHLEGLSRRYNRPVLFTEAGYRSIEGTSIEPAAWDKKAAFDEPEQANAYQAAFETFWRLPWFAGTYWWNVITDPYQGGPGDTDYTPLGKEAEKVLREYYQTP
jgi:hypothetical protein